MYTWARGDLLPTHAFGIEPTYRPKIRKQKCILSQHENLINGKNSSKTRDFFSPAVLIDTAGAMSWSYSLWNNRSEVVLPLAVANINQQKFIFRLRSLKWVLEHNSYYSNFLRLAAPQTAGECFYLNTNKLYDVTMLILVEYIRT